MSDFQQHTRLACAVFFTKKTESFYGFFLESLVFPGTIVYNI